MSDPIRLAFAIPGDLATPTGGMPEMLAADGAGELPKQVTNNLVQTMEMLKATTGLDVESLIQKYSGTNGTSAPSLAGGAPDGDGRPAS